ncbi:MAG: transcriptional regulator [Marinosulfonomonas sp.]|nr:MAG: transcriptional regulator [Marinosulfonomonas sp.]
MQKSGLTGSRIRESRLGKGLRQVELARNVGISPTYLNLIEHNRRRIGGKLLVDISRELNVDPSSLSEGVDVTLLEALNDAAARFPGAQAETARADEMAGRFPGFAALLMALMRKSEELEQTVEELNDRLAHDLQLADSLHEVLSVVTAIHSTSSILADDDDIDADWQARFHRNLYEDSQRLADSAQALVEYLASSDEENATKELSLPFEELEAWLTDRDFHIPLLEGEYPVAVDELMSREPRLNNSATSRTLSISYLQRYRTDALTIPQHRLDNAISSGRFDPLAIAQEFDSDLATVLRRIACLKQSSDILPVGLVVCDGSGALTFRKHVDGFTLPRFGATCPLLPLYQALSKPMTPIRQVVEQSGHHPRRFLTYAIAQPTPTPDFNMPQLFEATMLILPEDHMDLPGEQNVLPVGSSCRTCPRTSCVARREPSILTYGF